MTCTKCGKPLGARFVMDTDGSELHFECAWPEPPQEIKARIEHARETLEAAP